MTMFQLYILTRCQHINDMLCQAVAFLAGLVALICAISILRYVFIQLDEYRQVVKDEKVAAVKKTSWPLLKRTAILLTIVSILAPLVPNNRDLYVMIGGYYVTNNDEIKKMPNNVLKAANNFLEEFAEKPVNAKEVIKEVKSTIEDHSK